MIFLNEGKVRIYLKYADKREYNRMKKKCKKDKFAFHWI